MHRLLRFGMRSLLLFTLLTALSLFAYQQTYRYYRSHVFITVAKPGTGEIVTHYRYRTRLLYPGIIPANELDNYIAGDWQIHNSKNDLCVYAPPDAKLEVQIDAVEPKKRFHSSIVDPANATTTNRWIRQLQLSLTPTQRRTGIVIDQSTDLPIANAVVSEEDVAHYATMTLMDDATMNLIGPVPKTVDSNVESVTTDSDGRFTLPWANPKRELLVRHPEYVHVQALPDDHGILRLKRGVTIRGMVLDTKTEQPAGDVELYFIKSDPPETLSPAYVLLGTTNKLGEYDFTVERWQLEKPAIIGKPGYATQTQILDPDAIVHWKGPSRIDEPDRKRRETFSNVFGRFENLGGPGGSYRGYIMFNLGNNRLNGLSKHNSVQLDLNFKDGTAEFSADRVPYGDSWLVLERNGFPILFDPLSIDRDRVELGNIDIPVSGSIKGAFYNESDGAPASFREILFTSRSSELRLLFRCDHNGILEIPYLPPGTYAISENIVKSVRLGYGSSFQAEIRAGEKCSIDNRYQPLIEFEGIKVDARQIRCEIAAVEGNERYTELKVSNVIASNGKPSHMVSGRNIPPGVYRYSNLVGNEESTQTLMGSVKISDHQVAPKHIVVQQRILHADTPQMSGLSTVAKMQRPQWYKQSVYGKMNVFHSQPTYVCRGKLYRNGEPTNELEFEKVSDALAIYVDIERQPDKLELRFADGTAFTGPIQWDHNRWLAKPVDPNQQ